MATATQILEDLKSGKYSVDKAQELLTKLKLSELKKVTYKVSPKGAISFYGIRRLPITLYSEEFTQLMEIGNSIEFQKFLVDNEGKLSLKGDNKDQ